MPYQQLLRSIATTIGDYRQGVVPAATQDHVERWVNQFTLANRFTLLQELDHVLRNCYIREASFRQFIWTTINNPNIVGNNPGVFWRNANILRMQGGGHSQAVMLQMFNECLQQSCGLQIQHCGSGDGPYVYLDDAIFSGGQLKADLEPWIRNIAPQGARILAIVMVSHTSAEDYLLRKWIQSINRETGKNIDLRIWRCHVFENQRTNRARSDVYWPAVVPQIQAVQQYVNAPQQFPLDPRQAGGANQVFASEAGRQIIETEFLAAGVSILGNFQARSHQRPLGFGWFGVGFGATIVTYRNCPNNAPLALWWGDPNNQGGPLAWYPLLPRENRAQNFIRQAFANLNL